MRNELGRSSEVSSVVDEVVDGFVSLPPPPRAALHSSLSFKLLSILGVFLHLLFIDIPLDLLRWLTLRQKNVRGQVVVITGGGSGLGRRMASLLSLQHGAIVAVIDIDENGGHECVEEIVNEGGSAHFWKADITNDEELNLIAAKIEQQLGPVRIVICNAAVLFFGLFMELTQQQLQKAIDVNILGTINTIRACLGRMEKRNTGHVVVVSSIAGHAGDTFGLAYCPTKFAVRGVIECLEMELRDRGIHGIACTTLCPYFARTPMILNVGMRPTSTLFPFMSIDSCSRRMVDAILKEKVIAFIPNYVTWAAMLRPLSSLRVRVSLRDFLNCRYEPVAGSSSPRLLSRMADVFRPVHIVWWFIIPPALIINFLAWHSPELLRHSLPILGPLAADLSKQQPQIVVATNIFAVAAHAVEGLLGLAFSVQAGHSFATAAKWFLQTFVFGFPSLRMIKAIKDKRKRH